MALRPDITAEVEIVFRLDSGGGWLDYRIKTPNGVFVVKTEQVVSLSGKAQADIRGAFDQ